MNELKAYHRHLERLGYAKKSVEVLVSYVKDFLETISKPLQEMQALDIANYHQYLRERPNKRSAGSLCESTINQHIYSLKLLFAWQIETEKLVVNPMSSLELSSAKSKLRDILSIREIKTLYDRAETLKEKAILSLFYGCGLRRSEGVCLNVHDVHFRTNLLYVREGKGKRRRAVPMSVQVKNDLENYVLNEREKTNNASFIINNRIERMSGDSFNNSIKTMLKRAEINKEISLHCLRHSIATHLLESGLSVEYVRDFLGHKNLETTQIYTRVSDFQLLNLNEIKR